MSAPRFPLSLWLALLSGVFASSPGPAQSWRSPTIEEPRWLTLRVDQAATGVYAEGYEQTTRSAGSPSSTQTRLFVGPLIGLGLSGSVYHPNLFNYRVTADGAFGYTQEDFRGAVNHSDTQVRFLGSFLGNAKFLDNKPLHGTLFGGYSQTYQDYDFFNRIYIDRWRYGAGLQYSIGPVALSGTVYRDTQDSTGYGIPLKSEDNTASVDASYNRTSGSTTVGATLTRFDRNDFGLPMRGEDYTFAAADSEDFGSHKQFHSLINLSLNHQENESVPADLFNALANVRADHTERLSSQYSINYARNIFGSARTDNVNGDASLQHRLYDSLTTVLSVRGYRYSASTGPDSQDSWQFGGGPGLNYIKKLTPHTTLTAYETLVLLHTEVTSTGGAIPVIQEAHTVGENGAPPESFFLAQPNVIVGTILITDTNRVTVPNTQYRVIPGQLTRIERVSGLMASSVLVSYTFDASPSGSYNTLANGSGIRLDFFDHHWSIYSRLNFTRNYGGLDLLLQDITDWVTGTEGTWRFLRAGFEYENYRSNLSPFRALRFFQNFTFYPEENSSLSLNFSESYLTYPQAVRTEQNYTGILRYSRSLTRHLGLNLDLGATQRIGVGIDQTLAVFRPQLQYTVGKLSASIGYDFGYDEYLHTEQRIRNLGFIRLRKDF